MKSFQKKFKNNTESNRNPLPMIDEGPSKNSTESWINNIPTPSEMRPQPYFPQEDHHQRQQILWTEKVEMDTRRTIMEAEVNQLPNRDFRNMGFETEERSYDQLANSYFMQTQRKTFTEAKKDADAQRKYKEEFKNQRGRGR